MWYAAHIIETIKIIIGEQTTFPVFENIVLIEALSKEEAWKQANNLVEMQESIADETITLNGNPARQISLGIRKIVECQQPTRIGLNDEQIGSGWEISYLQFEVNSESELLDLANGKPVKLIYF